MTSQTVRQSSKLKKSSSSWRVMTLGEIGEIVSGGTPSTAVPEYWGGDINWISPSDLTGYKKKTIKEGAKSITNLGLKNSSARMIPKGSVLFSSRAPIGYVAIAADDLSTNQGFKSIIPHDYVLSEYLYYFLKASKQAAEEVASGTTFKEISKSTFAELKIPIPDKTTQQDIVSKIEELFSELDKGIESLKLAQQQLKVYRQSVLKWAFEGRLTEEFRINYPTETGSATLANIHSKRLVKLKNGTSKGSGESNRIITKIAKHNFEKPVNILIPKGWCWSSLLNSCYLVIDCHNKTAPYQEEGVLLIRTSNIKNGALKLDEKIKFVSDKIYEYWSRRCPPEPGDILFTREAPMGEAPIIPISTKICMGQRIMLFRTFPELLLPKYLHFAIMEPGFQRRMDANAIGTGVKHLRVGDVEKLVFPICSFREQEVMVSELESKLSLCNKMDESINQGLLQSEALRQSILKRAFEG